MLTNNEGMNRSNLLCPSFLLAFVMVAACDSSDESQSLRNENGAESADDDGTPEIGGGYDPDPSCEYDCTEINDDESICIEQCPDNCFSIILNRETTDASGVTGVGSISEVCPDQLPDRELGILTCELEYAIPTGDPVDCEASFSDEACETALNECLDRV
ncbi:MAG: hypothetical protein JKY37_23695 [Nannocystaceae bacterium]|nr:hypothetical protein [Nannocystaceae bacterium]